MRGAYLREGLNRGAKHHIAGFSIRAGSRWNLPTTSHDFAAYFDWELRLNEANGTKHFSTNTILDCIGQHEHSQSILFLCCKTSSLTSETLRNGCRVRNCPTMHCKPLSIEYIMYAYRLFLFYLILKSCIWRLFLSTLTMLEVFQPPTKATA